jgi:RsiW-degrading membrane proteinase PrsW (M82 family)
MSAAVHVAGAPAMEPSARAQEARAQALTESGWGTRFRFGQIRNLCYYVMVIGWAGGATVAFHTISPSARVYTTALTFGIVAFAVYAIPWWAYLNHLNRLSIVPRDITLVAFLWGFLGATFWIALRANDAILELYGKLFGHAWVKDYGAGLTAPFTEETAKGLGLILLLGLAPRIVRTPFAGFVIGAFIGLGFQISEDILYAFESGAARFGSDQAGQAAAIFGARGIAGLFSHTLYSALYCAGLIWLLDRDGSGRRGRGLGLMLLAMLLHGTWDTGGSYLFPIMPAGAAAAVNYVLTIAVALIAVRLVLRTVERDASRWIAAVLQPEVDGGVLSQEEATAAAGGRKARKALRRAQGSHRAGRIAKHVVAAAEDLAQALARSGGRDTSEVAHARAEVARLRA